METNNKPPVANLAISDIKTVDEKLVDTDLSGGNLDKIRDILFGAQIRTYEKRLTRLEERLSKETNDLKDEIRRRFDQLETSIKRDVDSLGDRLKVEARERSESVNDLSREVKDNNRNLDRKLVTLDDQTTKAQRELQQQLIEKSKGLSDDLQRKYDQLISLFEREVQELRYDKTDRATLAAFFTEAAMRLNNEFKLPGSDK